MLNRFTTHEPPEAAPSAGLVDRAHEGLRGGEISGDEVSAGEIASRRRFRVATLARLRWAAVTGQTVTILVTRFVFGFEFPWLVCLALVAVAAALNLTLHARGRANRVREEVAFAILAFDIAQLGLLIFFTGGMTNPFAIFIMAPAVAASTTMPVERVWRLGALAALFVTLVALWYVPLPWGEVTPLNLPPLYVAGHWTAIVLMIAFTLSYAYRAAEEGRKLADALAATELVLQREQHLSALDGLAAAAAHELGTPLGTITVVAREMQRGMHPDDPLAEDVELLRSQAARCREILTRLTQMGAEGDAHLATVPLTALVEDVVAPHRGFDVAIETPPHAGGDEPVMLRNPGIVYGLGNLVENAVDFAVSRVGIRARWDEETVALEIADDGPGFPAEVLARVGEPFMSRRPRGRREADARAKKGMGLGLFIAKTLLERTGAGVTITNASRGQHAEAGGALVTVAWPRSAPVFVPFLATEAGGERGEDIAAGALPAGGSGATAGPGAAGQATKGSVPA